jgi:catechol 2,3-dioxygenase-like lactoylglutathione lyase family enzyme
MQPLFIDHIVIIAKELERTERFYSVFLGEPEHRDAESVCFKVGETKLFFVLPYGDFEKTGKDSGSLNHLAFGVRTLNELRGFEGVLRKAGIQHSGVQLDKYGNKEFIWFDDPDGYRLEFYCRAAE